MNEIKTQFTTREGAYKLLTHSEYSRPNRVPFNSQGSNPVKVSFVNVNDQSGNGDRICFNVGRELYFYIYKGVRKVNTMHSHLRLPPKTLLSDKHSNTKLYHISPFISGCCKRVFSSLFFLFLHYSTLALQLACPPLRSVMVCRTAKLRSAFFHTYIQKISPPSHTIGILFDTDYVASNQALISEQQLSCMRRDLSKYGWRK